MRMRKRKTTALLLTGAMLLSLAGCNSRTEEAVPGSAGQTTGQEERLTAAGTHEAAESEAVTLKILMPGDRPKNMDAVIEEAEKRMADEGLNIHLNLVFSPWSDVKQKIELILTSGEEIDLVWDNTSSGMATHISKGYFTELTDLLNEYGPSVISTRGEKMFEANRYSDGIYAIPLGSNYKQGIHYNIRKDLREAMGMEPITNRQQLLDYAYKIKEKYPELIPITTAGASEPGNNWTTLALKDTDILASDLGEVTLYFKEDGSVYNFFDTKDPQIWALIEEARKLYEDGIMDPDVLAQQNYSNLIWEGKAAICTSNDFIPDASSQAKLKGINPEAEVESVILTDLTPGKQLADFKQWNFICLSNTSKHKEEAIRFLEWANGNQENYDLLAYGIEGTDWKAVGKDKYEVLGDGYRWFPYAWIWNPECDRIAATATENEYAAEKFYRDANNFKESKLVGFAFDSTPVTTSVSLHKAAFTEYACALYNGVIDPETAFENWKKADYNNVKTIQEEMQRQVDEFLKDK